MPTRNDMCNNTNSVKQDFMARDIENLVSEIKENLRLSGMKARNSKRNQRPSPYSTSSRSLLYCDNCSKNHISTCNHVRLKNTDDPYEMLQDLLRDGDLIKEAVRRLQKGLSSKQRYFYDSDEECKLSPLRLYNLEVNTIP